MLIKNIKILFLLVAISIFNSGCSSVKEAFDPQRKNGSEEFLVEKKAPLSMPPNFNELPEVKCRNHFVDKKFDEGLDEILKIYPTFSFILCSS